MAVNSFWDTAFASLLLTVKTKRGRYFSTQNLQDYWRIQLSHINLFFQILRTYFEISTGKTDTLILATIRSTLISEEILLKPKGSSHASKTTLIDRVFNPLRISHS